MDAFTRRFEQHVLPNRKILESILKREGRMGIEEFIQYGQTRFEQIANDPATPQDIHTEGIVKLHRQEDSLINSLTDSLVATDWFIFEAAPRWPFITSDNPGFCIDANEGVHNLNFADCVGFAFPLSPRFMLLMMNYSELQKSQIKSLHYRQANSDLVSSMNRATYSVSYKRLLSNDTNALQRLWFDIHQSIVNSK